MRYVYGVLIPLLLQALIVYVVIEMNTGNGSFVGLGAYLIGMIAIPLTAVVNAVYIKSNPKKGAINVILKCFLFAALTPLLIILLNIV